MKGRTDGAKNKDSILYTHEVLPLAGSLFPVTNGEVLDDSGIMENNNAPDILAMLTASGCNFFYETECAGDDVQLSLLPGNCGHYICQTCMQILESRNNKGCPICMPVFEKNLTAKCLAAKVAMSARLDIHDLSKDGKDVRVDINGNARVTIDTTSLADAPAPVELSEETTVNSPENRKRIIQEHRQELTRKY